MSRSTKGKVALLDLLKRGVKRLKKEEEPKAAAILEKLIAVVQSPEDEDAARERIKRKTAELIQQEAKEVYEDMQDACEAVPNIWVYEAAAKIMLNALRGVMAFEPTSQEEKELMHELIRESALNVIAYILQAIADPNAPTKH